MQRRSRSDVGNSHEEAAETIGYGSPPRASRWTKGQSGNPAGRKKVAEPPTLTLSNAFGAAALHSRSPFEIELEKALEQVFTIREGDKVIKTTASAAIIRNTISGAARLNPTALRHLVKLLQDIKDGRSKMQGDILTGLARYKAEASSKLEVARLRREPEPDFAPHPDDIEIDWSTGTVQLLGPANFEQRYALEDLVAELPNLCEDVRGLIVSIQSGTATKATHEELALKRTSIGLAVDYVERKATRTRARNAMDQHKRAANVIKRGR